MDQDKLQSRFIELEEQLKLCQVDLKKKDDIIKDLSSMEIKHSSGQSSESNQCRAELASIQLQVDNMSQKLNESEINLKSRTEQVEEQRAINRDLNEQIAKLVDASNELQAKLVAADQTLSELNCVNARSELVITSLQKELQEARDKIISLEKEIKGLAASSHEATKKREGLEVTMSNFYKDLHLFLNLESDSNSGAVLKKIKDVITENNAIKGEVANLKAMAAEREEKYLESRESYRSLMQSVEKERGSLEDYIGMKRELTFEIDKMKLEKKTAEIKNSELTKTIGDLEATLHDTKQLLDEKEAKLSKICLEKRETSFTMNNVSRDFEQFRESLAGLLGSSLNRCIASEDLIKDRVRAIVSEMKDKENTICQLDSKLKSLTEQYERTHECSKDTGIKARRIELEYLDLKDRIRQLEKELATRDVTRDLLRAEKEKFYHFLRRLAGVFQMDPFNNENDIDLIFSGIMSRATQVVNNENERNIDTSQTINGLKKRLRDTKDKLDSRDLHLELMRKKLTEQDDKLREAFEDADMRRDLVECENELKGKLGKMQKKIDQLRDENKALKAELFECSDVKIAANNQIKELETLQHNIQKLERVRQKQAERIAELTKSVEIHDSEATQSRFVADNAVQSLTSELKAMRSHLERARRSEKELLDFRVVVGRIIGLCVDNLAIPNYDIIRRLEKLAAVPHSGVTVAVPVQHYPLRNGFEDANRLLGRKRRSPNRTGYHDSGRPRSVSPVHEVRDSRKY